MRMHWCKHTTKSNKQTIKTTKLKKLSRTAAILVRKATAYKVVKSRLNYRLFSDELLPK